jgi:hypothetical protein
MDFNSLGVALVPEGLTEFFIPSDNKNRGYQNHEVAREP